MRLTFVDRSVVYTGCYCFQYLMALQTRNKLTDGGEWLISRPVVLASSFRSHLYSAFGFVLPRGGLLRARRRWNQCGPCARNWLDSRSWTDLSAAVGDVAVVGGSAVVGSNRRTTVARYRQYWPFYRFSVSAPLWTDCGQPGVISIRKTWRPRN